MDEAPSCMPQNGRSSQILIPEGNVRADQDVVGLILAICAWVEHLSATHLQICTTRYVYQLGGLFQCFRG